jgi:guanylate kinase
MPRQPLLLILAGPAGSGKSTLCDRLVDQNIGFSRVVTTTTRAPREGEINGIDYHFFSHEDFDTRIQKEEFLEWAWVHGHKKYGTLKSSVLDPLKNGQDLVMSVDVQGVESFRKFASQSELIKKAIVTIFIVIDHERLLNRMRLRGKDDEVEIANRMKTAEKELKEQDKFDYRIHSNTRDDDFAALTSITDRERKARM